MVKQVYYKSIFESINSRLEQSLLNENKIFKFYVKNENDFENIVKMNFKPFEKIFIFNEDCSDGLIQHLESKNFTGKVKILISNTSNSELLTNINLQLNEIELEYSNIVFIRIYIFIKYDSIDRDNQEVYDLTYYESSIFKINWESYIKAQIFEKNSEEKLELTRTKEEFYNKLLLLPDFFRFNMYHLDGIIVLFLSSYSYSLTKSHLKLREYFLLTINAYIKAVKSLYNREYLSLGKVCHTIIEKTLENINDINELADLANAANGTINNKRKELVNKGFLKRITKGSYTLNDKVLEMILKEDILNKPMLDQIEDSFRFEKIKFEPGKDYSDVLNIKYLETYIES